MWFNEPILLDEASCAHLLYCMLLRRILIQNSKFQLVECIANVYSFEYGICSWLNKMRAQRKARISVCIVSQFPDVSRNGNINNCVCTCSCLFNSTSMVLSVHKNLKREKRQGKISQIPIRNRRQYCSIHFVSVAHTMENQNIYNVRIEYYTLKSNAR